MKNEEDSLSLRTARGADAKKKRRTKIRRVKKWKKSKGRLREPWKKTKRRNPKKNGKRKGPMNSRKRNMKGKKTNGRRRGKFVRNDTDCHVEIYKYMKQYGDIVKNFGNQKKRAEKHIQLMAKKKNKSQEFLTVANLLIRAGGGNAASLTCPNDSLSLSLNTLTQSLLNCPKNIDDSCGSQAYTPLDKTFVNNCMKLTLDFTLAVTSCSSSSDCKCWNDKNIKGRVNEN